MNQGVFTGLRRRIAVLWIAVTLALTTAVAPMLLDVTATTSLSMMASACSGSNGGC